VCVSHTGALPEVVGDLGVQCDPLREDSIAQALTRTVYDREMRQRCRVEGPVWAERFTWARTAQGLANVCRELVP
jgi:glycosyltransferase involved in cell wall biosynthesis